MDTLTPMQRSERMSRIKGKNTTPEVIVRSLIHSLGFRYRLHQKALPGSPDIVLKRHRKIVFIHGCFWHRHSRCKRRLEVPGTNPVFWQNKFDANVNRDKANQQRLRAMGWKLLVVWECETCEPDQLARKLLSFLAGGKKPDFTMAHLDTTDIPGVSVQKTHVACGFPKCVGMVGNGSTVVKNPREVTIRVTQT